MKKYLVAGCLFILSCSKDAAPDIPPVDANGEILFISRRIPNNADWQLVLMNADGTNQRVISDKLVVCARPVFSGDGTKIAFVAYENGYYNLYTSDKNGQNQKSLSRAMQYCGSPAWSPDGNRLVFVKSDDPAGGNYDLYTIAADGTDEKRLTSQHGNFSPQYSPAGNSIIFSSAENGLSGIYQINTDGSNRRLLTPPDKSFAGPRVSPDGRLIAMTSSDRNGSQLFVMNVDGDNLKQLTFTVSPDYFDSGFPRPANSNPVWSPNSNRIAYVSYENGSPDIFAINPDGTGKKRLTDSPLRDEDPCWTNDGNYIIFSSNRNLQVSAEIYIMRADGQLQAPLTNYIADDIYPSFVLR